MPAQADPVALATGLELRLCVERLLTRLSLSTQGLPERPGRHQVLAEIIQHSPLLHRSLLEDNESHTLTAWQDCLAERGTDVRLQHTLAVLYRERALGDDDGDEANQLGFASALWALLLSTEAFWDRASERVLDVRTELLDSIAGELFGRQAAEGRRALAEEQPEAAKTHLRGLVAAKAGADELVEILKNFGLPYHQTIEPELMTRVSDAADAVLADWSADVVRTAEKALEDPDAIARLPKGISKNWEGAVDVLRPFARVGVPVAQVLRAGLEWHVDWCYALYGLQEHARIKTVLKSASQFARELIPLGAQGRGHQPENQVLSKYFMFRGFAAKDPDEQLRELDRAIAWNPNNDNAKDLRSDLSIGHLITKGFAAADEKRYPAAIEHLRAALNLEHEPDKRAKIIKNLAAIHNEAGVDVIERTAAYREKFSMALDEIIDAVKLRMNGQIGVTPNPASINWGKIGSNCAVCDNSSTGYRRTLILEILQEVRTAGTFSVENLVKFWTARQRLLCSSCKTDLDLMTQAKYMASRHFRKAIELNPNHPSAQSNLAMVEKMGGE
jgi:tetratricopeptide (TPR) repeat protein